MCAIFITRVVAIACLLLLLKSGVEWSRVVGDPIYKRKT